MEDNPNYFWGSKLSPTAMTVERSPIITVEEQYLLAKYTCLNREQLAELREAFLMFATWQLHRGEMKRCLHWSDFGRCLRAVGQNPSKAMLAQLTKPFMSSAPSPQQYRHTDDESTGAAAPGNTLRPSPSNADAQRRSSSHPSNMGRSRNSTASIRKRASSQMRTGRISMHNTNTAPQSSRRVSSNTNTKSIKVPARTGMSQTRVGRHRSSTMNMVRGMRRSSVTSGTSNGHQEDTPAQQNTTRYITIDDYLAMCNTYGQFMRPEADLAKDFDQALRVFDDDETGLIDVHRLRKALLTYGEAMTESEVNELIFLVDNAIREDGLFEIEALYSRLTAV